MGLKPILVSILPEIIDLLFAAKPIAPLSAVETKVLSPILTSPAVENPKFPDVPPLK